MSFVWREFLTLAEGLVSHPNSLGSSEASFRSAASRAYYAAYQCALEFACREGFEPYYGESGHVYLQKHFSRHRPLDKTYQKISTQLNRLRDIRVKADYQSTFPGRPDFLASSAVGMAKIVLKCLDILSEGN